jgi:hypothetical protein
MTLPRALHFSVIALVSTAALASSHCARSEINYFTCKIKNSEKLVSLCGIAFRDNGDPTAQIKDTAWIQYRFGKPGHLELIYPAKKVALVGRFSGECIVANDRRLYALMFKNGNYKYEILSSPLFRGVVVEGHGSKTELSCDGEPKTEWAAGLNNYYQLVQDLSDER